MNLANEWKPRHVKEGFKISDISILFEKIDKKTVEEERKKLAGEYDVEFLLDCLLKNEKAGIVYHYPCQLNGDYDVPETEEGIFDLLLNGKKAE